MATDIKQSFSKQIAKINIKASSFIEENKIKMYLDSLNKEIEELQKKCGEQSYQMWQNQEFNLESLVPIFQKLSEKWLEVQKQNEKLTELQKKNRQMLGEKSTMTGNGEVCPKCGAPCTPDMNFCKGCGTKLH